jgi:hypothetical protein
MNTTPLTKEERELAAKLYRSVQERCETGPAKDTEFCKKLVGILQVIIWGLESPELDNKSIASAFIDMHNHCLAYYNPSLNDSSNNGE